MGLRAYDLEPQRGDTDAVEVGLVIRQAFARGSQNTRGIVMPRCRPSGADHCWAAYPPFPARGFRRYASRVGYLSSRLTALEMVADMLFFSSAPVLLSLKNRFFSRRFSRVQSTHPRRLRSWIYSSLRLAALCYMIHEDHVTPPPRRVWLPLRHRRGHLCWMVLEGP